jgi:hypothetical protein
MRLCRGWRPDVLQITQTAHFANDLGLDSLDTVEVVMAIEEVRRGRQVRARWLLTDKQEFSIEIPDKDADNIHSGRLRPGFPSLTSRPYPASILQLTPTSAVDAAVKYILSQPDAN